MHDRFKETVDALQAAILEDAAKDYSPKVIERWQNPKNWGQMENPDGLSRITGPCGDTMQISLKVTDRRIAEVRFMTDGCASSIASGSMATELAQGKPIEEARNITPEMINDGVGRLPEESEHCAILASTVLRAAIDDYLGSKREKK